MCSSLLPARCRGMRAQRETTLLRRSRGGDSGATLPCGPGKRTRGKGGRGGQLTKGLGFVLEKTTEKDQVRVPSPSPQHTCICRPRGARTVFRVLPQSQKNRVVRVFCLIGQYTFHTNFLKGLFLNLQRTPSPGKHTPCWWLLIPPNAL